MRGVLLSYEFMEGNFRRILTLIDYTAASLYAAREAALIASKFDSDLSLLHVSPDERSGSLITPGVPFFDAPEKEEDEYYLNVDQLEKIKRELNRCYSLPITCFEERGSFIDVVKQHVTDLSIDLIVLGTLKRNWVRDVFIESKARSIIRSVGCEVLCVQPKSEKEALRNIVLPVGKSVPKKKIGIAYELAKKFAAKIHLIALNKQDNNSNDESTKALVGSYQYLKNVINIPIECNKVDGKSLADAAMHYAEIVEADLILIDEGSESDLKMPLWSGHIVNHSSVPVLSVHAITSGEKKLYRA